MQGGRKGTFIFTPRWPLRHQVASATGTKFGLSRGLLGLQYDQINASESEYEEMESLLRQIPGHEDMWIGADLNGHVEEQEQDLKETIEEIAGEIETPKERISYTLKKPIIWE